MGFMIIQPRRGTRHPVKHQPSPAQPSTDQEQEANSQQPSAINQQGRHQAHPPFGTRDPAHKSFHSLCAEHPNFAVRPLCWTAKHLEVVNCKFQLVADTDDNPTPLPQFQSRMVEVTRAFVLSSSASAERCCKKLLTTDDSPLYITRDWVCFHFGKYTKHVRDCIPLGILPGRSDYTQTIAGFWLYNASDKRRKRFIVPRTPGGLDNAPVRRKYARKLENVTPSDWWNDPYILAILIGLAQAQYDQGRREDFFKTRLLVTHLKQDNQYAYVFKADFPRQLLQSLYDPFRSIDDFEFPDIKYTKVSFEPYSNFQERIKLHFGVIPAAPRGEKRSCEETDAPVAKVQKQS